MDKVPKKVQADLQSRQSHLLNQLAEKKLDAFLVSSVQNRYYLTGWLGDTESGSLLLTPKENFLITDSRYTEEVTRKVQGFTLVEIETLDFWSVFLKKLAIKRIGFEAEDLSVAALKRLKRQAKEADWVGTERFIEEQRGIKDKSEVSLLRQAISISDKAFSFILKNIKPGQTEIEIALQLEHFMKKMGASKNAWENLIVASGENSSMIHYAAGERKIQKGDQIQLDWGCVYSGYHSDISRVIFMGSPTSKQGEVYNLVIEAQRQGYSQIKIGQKLKSIDLAARDFLKAKISFYFKHAVGHGVGLEVHELPRVSEKSNERVTPGQVFTVEPGVYEPGWGGVRIEDMVFVTESGYEVLTTSPREIKGVIVQN